MSTDDVRGIVKAPTIAIFASFHADYTRCMTGDRCYDF
jgi:hypothetical protein